MLEIVNASLPRFSEDDIQKLYDIVIKGYELTEEEVWGKKYIRIFPEEYKALVKKKEVLVALYDNEIVGGIQYYFPDKATSTFSLLATNFVFKGKGIGTALINEVEKLAKIAGASMIKIEILRVRGLDVDCKMVLANYYNRLGYKYTHSEDCICKIHAEKYKKLEAPSDFDFYEKLI